jgi:hypothetical protein
MVILTNLLDELKRLCRWVNWRFVAREKNGLKPKKVPIDPKTGGLASCSDPGTWGTFEQAEARCAAGAVDGVGFQLGEGYTGVDLDDCRDPGTGEIESWALEIVSRLSSYAEVSPSGTGVHIILLAALPPTNRRKGPIEMYDAGRFFTITGAHIEGTPVTIENRQVELDALHAEVFGAGQAPRDTQNDGVRSSSFSMTDDQLLKAAHTAANSEKFAQLWNGDFSDYPSQSEADLALCSLLAFWTGSDETRIDRLFRRSGLFRDKWDEGHSADGKSYGQLTIEKAIDSHRPRSVWAPPVADRDGRGPAAAYPAASGNGNGRSAAGNGGGGGNGGSSGVAAGSNSAGGGGATAPRPIIVYSNRQLADVTREALDALRASNSPPELFVRGGHLVRSIKDEDGRPVIDTVGEHELRSRLAAVSNAIRFTDGGRVNCCPGRETVQNILALGEWPFFPPLQAIIEAPVLRSDGTILNAPGYDPPTRLIYVPAKGLDVPEIPAEPTSLDVAASLDCINDVIGEFPFDSEASRANTLGLMLTPIVRPAINGNTPLGLIDAPQMGTGKGLLAEIVGLVATGRDCAMMSAPNEEDEWRKRITATLRSGATVIIIDNVERQLKCAALASALTARVWRDRILGLSEMATLPVRATWIATGNNIRVGGDLARRCYWTRLDAKISRPWERTGFKHPDLLAWVSENRGEILGALLTLARAWFAAGKPEGAVPAVGGFDEWARTVGGVIGFAGVSGFLGNLDKLYDLADESAQEWERFLEVLKSEFHDEPFTVKKLVDRIQSESRLNEALPDDVAFDTNENGSIHRRLGKAFSKREGRRYGDANLHLARAGSDRRAVKWQVLKG